MIDPTIYYLQDELLPSILRTNTKSLQSFLKNSEKTLPNSFCEATIAPIPKPKTSQENANGNNSVLVPTGENQKVR